MAIIDTYGLNVYLFSQDKGATFSNVKDGVRMAYTDTIIPETEQMYAAISHQIGLTEQGLALIPDFSHLPVLQHDELSKATAMEKRATILEKAKAAGIEIDEIEYREFLGFNPKK
jgi:hypothetical protein